jgi:hypothetical protein
VVCCLAVSSLAQTVKISAGLKRVDPARVDVDAKKLAAIDEEVEREIKLRHLPGAVVLVAR